MRKFVVDASVAVKWLLDDENFAGNADTLTSSQYKLSAPDIIYAEIGNAVWKRIKIAPAAQNLHEYFAELISKSIIELHCIKDLSNQALKITAEINHDAIYDCLYLALALKENCQLVTADEKFCKKVLSTKYENVILNLKDL